VQLTAERFKQIVVDARTQIVREHGRDDRRSSVRIGVRYRATVRPVDGPAGTIGVAPTHDGDDFPPPLPARVRDISSCGVGLTTKVALDGRFRLELPSEQGAVYRVDCSVESCRAVDINQFHIGARFEEAQAA
jgi:hypothetical protein